MILYQLTFKNLPRFDKHFATQEALFAYIDSCDKSCGEYAVRVREIRDDQVKIQKGK